MVVKKRQVGGDQMDLFDEALKASLRHGATGEGGTGTGACEERQAATAWDQNRALTQHLMEKVAGSANLNQAYKRVKANGGAPGVDGMTVADLRPWIADNRERLIASLLDTEYGIEARSGLHCAPLIHRQLGSSPGGTLRISAGHSTTLEQLHRFAGALREIITELGIC